MTSKSLCIVNLSCLNSGQISCTGSIFLREGNSEQRSGRATKRAAQLFGLRSEQDLQFLSTLFQSATNRYNSFTFTHRGDPTKSFRVAIEKNCKSLHNSSYQFPLSNGTCSFGERQVTYHRLGHPSRAPEVVSGPLSSFSDVVILSLASSSFAQLTLVQQDSNGRVMSAKQIHCSEN